MSVKYDVLRTNLVTNPRPQTTTSGYAAVGCTIANALGQSENCLEVTVTTGTAALGTYVGRSIPGLVIGRTYTVSAQIYCPD